MSVSFYSSYLSYSAYLDADVRLQHLAQVLVLVLEEVEQVLVVPEWQDLHTLVLTLESQARTFPPRRLFYRVPLVLYVPTYWKIV